MGDFPGLFSGIHGGEIPVRAADARSCRSIRSCNRVRLSDRPGTNLSSNLPRPEAYPSGTVPRSCHSAMKILLTGGCGFIGSAVVRHLMRESDHAVINVDKLTYAASEDALQEAHGHERHVLIRGCITDASAIRGGFVTIHPPAPMHLS